MTTRSDALTHHTAPPQQDQLELFAATTPQRRDGPPPHDVARMKTQLLKWIGNKQRFAHEIAGWFPRDIRTYHEPFIGSGAVLATLQPDRAIASDVLGPLIGIWQLLQRDAPGLVAGYAERRDAFMALDASDRKAWYGDLRDRYNAAPNALDLLFLARSCYGGVIRFSKKGTMNTPLGPHRPVSAAAFAGRVERWAPRVANVQFVHQGYQASLQAAREGDLVYCDPPYVDCEATLYGAQAFRLVELYAEIAAAKARGARVALSIDGSKRSGTKPVHLDLPRGLFEVEVSVNVGRSMLRRFQMEGQTLENEVVADRLLLTWSPGRGVR